jgi:hypothetical protein
MERRLGERKRRECHSGRNMSMIVVRAVDKII